jgi:hypothetical protein
MATNEVTTLRNAIVTILQADATMRTLAGRTSGFVVLAKSIATATRPVVAYQTGSNIRIGGNGHKRELFVLLEAYATGNGSQDKVEALTRRAREVLKKAAFTSAGASVIEVRHVERGVEAVNEDGTVTQDARHDLELLVELAAPQ